MDEIYIDGQFIRNRITQLRLEKGVSEREMSLSLGMCESYIRNITTAPSMPSMDSFLNICEYLCITPSEFFDTSLGAPNTTKETMVELERLFGNHMRDLTAWLKKLSPNHAEALMDVLAIGMDRKKKKK